MYKTENMICTCVKLVVSTVLLSSQAVVLAQTSVNVLLTNPGSSTVCTGALIELDIIATFDSRLSAADFKISATGTATSQLTGRSAVPGDPNGWTFISYTSQSPFEDNLPHDFSTGSAHEVLMDMGFGVPGDSEDGLSPGSDLLIERIEITPTSSGSLTIIISDLNAATTQGTPDGVLFETITIEQSSVALTVVDGILGDFDSQCDVDIADLQVMALQWLQTPGVPSADIAPDPLDDFINLLDFAVLVEQWLEGIQ